MKVVVVPHCQVEQNLGWHQGDIRLVLAGNHPNGRSPLRVGVDHQIRHCTVLVPIVEARHSYSRRLVDLVGQDSRQDLPLGGVDHLGNRFQDNLDEGDLVLEEGSYCIVLGIHHNHLDYYS